MGTVAIFGAGVMGETLLSGLLRAGRPAGELDHHRAPRGPRRRADREVRRAGARQRAAADVADTLVLVVKPQDMGGLLGEIHDHVSEGNLVVSLAAGITTTYLESRLPEGRPSCGSCPTPPRSSTRGWPRSAAAPTATAEHLAEAQALLAATGKVLEVPEKLQDAVTAISGSGPAYIFYVVEAMIEAGVVLGMPRATATELVVQTLFGAATMIKETGQHPTVLREQVTSPGGTTAAALRELDDHKVRAAFITAMEAAARRSHELAGE